MGPSESNVAILIMTSISASFCFMLIITIRSKILLDAYGYVAFYLFSIIKSILFLCLNILKIFNSILNFKRLKKNDLCKDKFKCPEPNIKLLIHFMNFIIFLLFLFCINFTVVLFLDSFNILISKNKTFFRRQIEINEKKNKGKKNEFKDDKDESLNNSLNQLKNKNKFKTE